MTERPPYCISVTVIIDVIMFIFDVSSSFRDFVVTKYHRLGSLNQQEFIVLQFWRLEICNQGVGRATFSVTLLGENLACFFWLWCLQAILGLQMYHSSLCFCCHNAVCSLSFTPLLIRSLVILD